MIKEMVFINTWWSYHQVSGRAVTTCANVTELFSSSPPLSPIPAASINLHLCCWHNTNPQYYRGETTKRRPVTFYCQRCGQSFAWAWLSSYRHACKTYKWNRLLVSVCCYFQMLFYCHFTRKFILTSLLVDHTMHGQYSGWCGNG